MRSQTISLPETNTQFSTATSSLISLLYLAVFLRPIVTIRIPFELAGLNLLELFSIVISCCLILAILINMHNIRINILSFFIVIFSLYCLLSIAWGSSIRDVARMILPFVIFFAIQALVTDQNKMKNLITLMILGYAVLIIANVVEVGILKSGSLFKVYETDLMRYGGLTSGSHSLAHSMFIFSVVFIFYRTQITKTSTVITILSFILLLMSFYCIYKTYTRTVYIGLFMFWGIYLWGTNKKYFLTLIGAAAIAFILLQSQFSVLFWDVTHAVEEKKYEKAGSGRISIWSDTLEVFNDFSIDEMIVGLGLGHEKTSTFKREKFFVAQTHNDYLGLLITTGALGLIFYLSIMMIYFLSAVFFNGDTRLKYLSIAFIVSALAMNMGSNSYVSRVELAQLFWLFAGLFYTLKQFHALHVMHVHEEDQHALIP